MQLTRSEVVEDRRRTEQEQRWLEENKAAFESYNQRVLQHGLLTDEAGLL